MSNDKDYSKKTKQELIAEINENEEKINTILEQSSIAYQIFDLNGVLQYANGSWFRLWGISDIKSVIGIYDVFKDSQIKKLGVLDGFKRALTGEIITIPEITYTYRRSEDSDLKRSVICKLYPLRHSSGQLKNIIVTSENISQAKKGREDLIQEKERARNILEGTNAGTWEWNIQTGELLINERWAGIMGYTLKELEPVNIKTWVDNVYPGDLAKAQQQIDLHFKQELEYYDVEFRQPHKNGSWVWVNARGKVTKFTEDGKPLWMTGTHLDITATKRSEEELKKSKENLAVIFNNTHDAIIRQDLTGKIIEANQTMLDMYKVNEKEVLKLTINDISGPEMSMKIAKKYWSQCLAGGKVVFEWQAKRPHENFCFSVEVTLKKILIDKEEFILGNIRDLTHTKEVEKQKIILEAQLNQAQKMEAVGTLAGGIAHNFNNILTGIQGYASLLKMSKNSTDQDSEYLENIEESVSVAADLTNQLLGFARGGRYAVKPINMNVLLKSENRMFGQTKKEIKIFGRYTKDIWTVEIDKGQIQQAILNLYVNAWQAMPKGGKLYVQTENVDVDRGYDKVFAISTGRYVKISITDTGTGMDADTKKRVFEPFFTTKDVGTSTGLGLASVYGIIKNHKGFINVYSEKGKGTTFTIYLPASDKQVIFEKKMSKKSIKGEGKLLLVDDEPMIGEVGKELLESLGYKVTVAESGEQAINIYKTNHDNIELVILDMIMPEMGGEETFDKLKEINPEVQVLLSSGYSLNGHAQDILNRGCKGFLQKPFTLNDLSEKVREIIKK